MSKNTNSIIATREHKNYNSIDVVKFLCSIFVFLIHIPLFIASVGGELSVIENNINFGLQKVICRIAVPFFFVCSGFFLFKNMATDTVDVNRVKNYCFKIVRILGMWSVLLFIGSQDHLWYLGATAIAIAFLSICLYHKVELKWLIVIACIFYVLGLLDDSYFGVIKPLVSEGIFKYVYIAYDFITGNFRSGFFRGYVFVLIGFLFSQGKFKLRKKVSLILFLISTLFLFAEAFLLKYYNIPRDYNLYIFILPTVFFLFSFVSSLSLKDRPIYAKLRTVGVLVYLLHLLIFKVFVVVQKGIYVVLNIDIQPFTFPISLTITLLVAFGIEWLSHKNKFKWIQWFLA